jgi:hypothetical protein|tara:strand:+ start:552 stop:1010 length:459 start_codon:yes stop_codon:yes gene_type:complete
MKELTPDGILIEEWDVVTSISASIVNNIVDSDDSKIEQALLKSLFSYLDYLELKYGKKASILATRADYEDDVSIKESLLLGAYDVASSDNDSRNKTFVSSSLAEFYIDENENENFESGEKWVGILEANLAIYHDEGEEQLLLELKQTISSKQ